MLREETQIELLRVFNELKAETPMLVEIRDGMEVEEFASNLVLVAVTRTPTPPPYMMRVAADITDNYPDFLQLVADVFYGMSNLN
jgi:hypothetical protein